jgi:hypothetical protein
VTILQVAARRRLTVGALGALAAVTSMSMSFASPTAAAPAAAVSLRPALSSAAAGSAGSSVTKSKRVERVFLNNGVTKVVDKRTVHVTVSNTRDLRSLQQVNVNWSGAHVTDGEDLDQNSDLAQNEEYSFDLFECRGVDSTKVPVKDRISPNTCWTQYADERYFAQGTEPAWQSDLYASAAGRKAIVGAPPLAKQPALCKSLENRDVTQRWLPFDAADGTVYEGGNSGCGGLPPEASPANLSSLSLPSNETFGVTAPNGTGHAQFDTFTSEDHASLGCSATVPCSLVAIPIEGLSCDPDGANLPLSEQPTQAQATAAEANCETDGSFTPGELLAGVETSGQPAVDGTLWWSASNWRNRISFPLTFAQADNICSIVSKAPPISLYGSELMTQATTQWSPHFCLNPKLFNLKLVQTPEPEARRLVAAGSVEAAASSYGSTPPYPEPTVNAPIAVSGFGIAFDVDDAKHNAVTRLNLDPRLLAKLLTESYPAQQFVKSEYPVINGVATLSNNPLSIADDPEFQALNPGIPERTADAAATLLTVNVQSDVMTALTTYINDDPAARAWLNGQPDPWGMRVNPNYKGVKLPVSSWPLLDTFEPLGEYKIGLNDCLAVDPLPYLPLVANPQSSLYQIALDADFSIAQPQTTCVLPSPIPGDTAGAKVVANGRQPIGDRFMLSVVSLADAARFNLSLASLETHSTVSPTTKFTSATGQTFVAPSNASMRAAVATVAPDKTLGTWPIDYEALRNAKNAGAYPGTMIVYAAVPTKGLPKLDAKDYGNFLQFTAGPGQAQGTEPGQLAAGYLPMTSSNGLAALADYTKRAAVDVAAQKGVLPSLIRVPSPKPTHTASPSPTVDPPASSSPASTSPPGVTLPTVNDSTPSTPSATQPSVAQSPPVVVQPSASPAALGMTDRIAGGIGSWLLPTVLILMVLAGGAAAGIRIRTGGRPK